MSIQQAQNPAGNDSALPHDSAGVDSAQPQHSARDHSARGDGPAAQGTPAGTAPVDRQDTSIVSDVSSLMFPSLMCPDNTSLFISYCVIWIFSFEKSTVILKVVPRSLLYAAVLPSPAYMPDCMGSS